MIRWCSYCQGFLGEIPPFDDPRFTHGICDRCDQKMARGENVMEQTSAVRSMFSRIMESARAGDEHSCVSILEEARATGLGTESILLGMLGPALYQAGLEWQGGQMSVASEHRLTSWCDRVFSMLDPGPRRSGPLDLLILQAPGNSHTLGPRFAAQVLRARGLSVEVVVPDLPLDEIVTVARELRPRLVGLSCALPSAVPPAVDLVTRVRGQLEPELCCRYVLGGFAFRLGGGVRPSAVAPGIEVVVDLEWFNAVRSDRGAPELPGAGGPRQPHGPGGACPFRDPNM
jgi:methanogenic corrinoid protein MtbC1